MEYLCELAELWIPDYKITVLIFHILSLLKMMLVSVMLLLSSCTDYVKF